MITELNKETWALNGLEEPLKKKYFFSVAIRTRILIQEISLNREDVYLKDA
jgi:hypothetical protein